MYHKISINVHRYYLNIAFPLTCDTFDGPHSLNCYRDIWKEAGCSDIGLAYPDDIDHFGFLESDTSNLL